MRRSFSHFIVQLYSVFSCTDERLFTRHFIMLIVFTACTHPTLFLSAFLPSQSLPFSPLSTPLSRSPLQDTNTTHSQMNILSNTCISNLTINTNTHTFIHTRTYTHTGKKKDYLFKDISFGIHPTSRIVLVGPNGAGTSLPSSSLLLYSSLILISHSGCP